MILSCFTAWEAVRTSYHLHKFNTLMSLKYDTLQSKAERNGGLGGTVQMNQECRESKGESKERRHRRVERRERKKGFKGVDCDTALWKKISRSWAI